jgi:hypothetical protein
MAQNIMTSALPTSIAGQSSRLVARLKKLGFIVQLQPIAEAA